MNTLTPCRYPALTNMIRGRRGRTPATYAPTEPVPVPAWPRRGRPPATDLTDRQREVFAELYYATCRDGYQPSLDEIGARLGVTGQCVRILLRAVADKGYVSLSDRGRGVRLIRKPDGSRFRGFTPL